MFIYKDCIYYTDDLSYGSLYKINTNGNNYKILSNNSPMYLNIYNDYIFYSGQNPSANSTGIYKIDLNGTNEQKLCNGDFDSLNIYGNNMYFNNSVDCSNIF